jgi:hypothetical protein
MTARPGRQALVMLGASLVLTTLAGTAAAHATSSRKPDLIVTNVGLHAGNGRTWVTRGNEGAFKLTWHHRTRNDGNGAAGKSKTGLRLVAGHRVVRLARVGVPRLAPDTVHKGGSTFSEIFDQTWDYGTYTTRACADVTHLVAEKNEGNNCFDGHPFYVIPSEFTGTIGGAAPLDTNVFPGVTVSWEGTVTADVSEFARGNHGTFGYVFFRGPVTYTVQGTDDAGCTWSGTGDYNPLHQTAPLDLQFGPGAHYSARDFVDPKFAFNVTTTCPGHITGNDGFSPSLFGLPKWLDTSPGTRPFDDPGLTALSGSYTDQRADGPTTYAWNLKPEDG